MRALAKIMDFLRAVSIILVVIHLYWYCYEAVRLWGIGIGVVDRVLMNFDRTAGLFHHILYTKLFALLLLALSCLGTKGVKEEKITWRRIWTVLAAGLLLFFGNWWVLSVPRSGRLLPTSCSAYSPTPNCNTSSAADNRIYGQMKRENP